MRPRNVHRSTGPAACGRRGARSRAGGRRGRDGRSGGRHRQTGAHVAGEVEGRDAGAEGERREGVPEIVGGGGEGGGGDGVGCAGGVCDNAQERSMRAAPWAGPTAGSEVVKVEIAAPWAGNTNGDPFASGSGRAREPHRLQRHGSHAGLGLRALDPAIAVRAAHVHHSLPQVDVAFLEGDPSPAGVRSPRRTRPSAHRYRGRSMRRAL